MLLKTSRGLKPSELMRDAMTQTSFSALEDEPWIEAEVEAMIASQNTCFSALEDEPWIEAHLRAC